MIVFSKFLAKSTCAGERERGGGGRRERGKEKERERERERGNKSVLNVLCKYVKM